MSIIKSQLMSIYLSFLDKPRHAQQLINQPHYLHYNKISVNKPIQSHFTVQGVQAYSPQQIKALRQRQTRIKQYDGQWAPLKVVLLSDKIIQFDEGQDPLKQMKQRELTKKEKTKQKPRPQTANKQRVKTNMRNAMSTNNQAIVKLQKQKAKKNSLQRKLQKMSQKYKQYFKDVDLKQGLKTIKKAQQIHDKSEQISQYEQQKPSQSVISEGKQEANYDKTTYHRSSKVGKSKKERKMQSQIEQNEFQQSEDINQSKNMSLDLAFDLVMQSTTYSEKLGTAIHEMFK